MAFIASEAVRASLLDAIIPKLREACFVDWVVGCIVAVYYGQAMAFGNLDDTGLWPLIGLLVCTRGGDAIKGSVREFVTGKYRERRANGC